MSTTRPKNASGIGHKTVEETAKRRMLTDCPYAFYFRDITCHYCDSVLILRGRLPTFYLKQILQTMLKDLDGVQQINNQVDVVSSSDTGAARRRAVASAVKVPSPASAGRINLPPSPECQ